jgi:hypothetical protein
MARGGRVGLEGVEAARRLAVELGRAEVDLAVRRLRMDVDELHGALLGREREALAREVGRHLGQAAQGVRAQLLRRFGVAGAPQAEALEQGAEDLVVGPRLAHGRDHRPRLRHGDHAVAAPQLLVLEEGRRRQHTSA